MCRAHLDHALTLFSASGTSQSRSYEFCARFSAKKPNVFWILDGLDAIFMRRVDFFLSTRKTKVGLLIELSTMVPLNHALLNGKMVESHQAYGIPVPGGARAGGRGAPVWGGLRSGG